MNDAHVRIEQLEASHAFSEHAADQLSAQLYRLVQEVNRLSQRIIKLEEQLASIPWPEESQRQPLGASEDEQVGPCDDRYEQGARPDVPSA